LLTWFGTSGNSAHYGVTSTGNYGTSGNPPTSANPKLKGTWINLFADRNAVGAQFRPLLPGLHTNAGGNGVLRGLPGWNLDMTVAKDLTFRERFGATFMFQFSNLLNHVRYADRRSALRTPARLGSSLARLRAPRPYRYTRRGSLNLACGSISNHGNAHALEKRDAILISRPVSLLKFVPARGYSHVMSVIVMLIPPRVLAVCQSMLPEGSVRRSNFSA
jgi:hypothetical protein